MFLTTYKHPILDRIRWTLILVLWIGGTVLLWRLAWYWGLLGLIPGYVVVLNVVGLAMVPIYGGVNARWAERDLLAGLTAERVRHGIPAGTPVSDEEGKVIAAFVNAAVPLVSGPPSPESPVWRARSAFGDRFRLDAFSSLTAALAKTGVPPVDGSDG